jgi:fluoride ion exporter CrcB/FEX
MNDLGPLHTRRGAWIAVGLLVGLYVATFFVLYPEDVTVTDEAAYVRQAMMLLRFNEPVQFTHPFTYELIDLAPKIRFPLGTAVILAPFLWAGGLAAVFLVPLLSTLLATGLTARWIAEENRSPLFALLLLGFPPTLVMSRVAMSDAPSMALIAAGLFSFWRANGSDHRLGFLAGLIAGLTTFVREANVLVFVPLFAGSLLRRDANWVSILIGGLIGTSVRLVVNAVVWDDPFFHIPPLPFELASVIANLPFYALALLVFVPGGLLGLAYRGPRRPEVVGTLALYIAFYTLYSYSGQGSGLLKRLVLGPRFFIPLLPLLAFAMAESIPRLWSGFRERLPERVAPALARVVVWGWLVGVAGAVVAVQWVHGDWGGKQAEIRRSIYENTPDGAVLIVNGGSVMKFIDYIYGTRLPLHRGHLDAREIAILRTRQPEFYLVLLDRTDSPLRRKEAHDNARFLFIVELDNPTELILDRKITPTDRLRIWRVPGVDS